MVTELKSKSINLRFIELDDAEYVLSLRKNEQYNKHLSPVNTGVTEQVEWIKEYKKREQDLKEFYFIIQRNDGVKCGTIRIYDIQNNSFCWGSWILDENKTKTAAIESALLIYKFGFDVMHFSRSHFDVRKDNTSVISFHKKFNAHEIDEDNLNYYFEIFPEDIEQIKNKYIRYTA
ncbi:GNAT family N-acetyltransferase [Providencia vermicola]|uniref:GNAT family N-acetyltransferase n=1 Tax=Providencia vermicola TaxID=333965 RepID=A0AAX3RYD2_9GAMM|nr:GNAT family N-acetyltransferase [Providencia vermicola]WFC07644.1 GNAT family N-acetyltransferase [Providencia vermicola]